MADGTIVRRLRPHPHQDHDLQAKLARWNRVRLCPQAPSADWRGALAAEYDMRAEEIAFIELTREAQAERAAEAPTKAGAFVDWFEALKQHGPGQGDPFFHAQRTLPRARVSAGGAAGLRS